MTNPLETAHAIVQDRKAACAMPQMDEVLSGEAEIPHEDQGTPMWSGTDLTEDNVREAVNVTVKYTLAMLMTGAVDIKQALTSIYIEGLLVGIEHGRSLAR